MVDAGRRAIGAVPRTSLLGGLMLFAAGLVVDVAAHRTWRMLPGRSGAAGPRWRRDDRRRLRRGGAHAPRTAMHPRCSPRCRRPGWCRRWSVRRWPASSRRRSAGGGSSPGSCRWRSAEPRCSCRCCAGCPPHVAADAADGPSGIDLGACCWPRARARAGGRAAGALVELRCWSRPGWRSDSRRCARCCRPGALRLARGPADRVDAARHADFGFFGAESYLPLTLTRVHHGSPRVVGIPLTLGALGWSLGSWWQGRRRRSGSSLLRPAFVLVAVGVALLVVVATPASQHVARRADLG